MAVMMDVIVAAKKEKTKEGILAEMKVVMMVEPMDDMRVV